MLTLKKRKRGFTAMVLVLAGALMLSACGGGNNNNNAGGNTGGANGGSTGGNTPSGGNQQVEETLSGSIVALGSSAMQLLVEEAAASFMEQHKDVQIQVQGGGSGTGLSQVASGGADIGNSDIYAEEKNDIDSSDLVDHKVAVVGMGAVAHPEVGVDNLTKAQLIDIFTGKIKNWSEVGGADQEIVLVNRPQSSGTRATFFAYALDKNEEAEGITEDSSGTVRKIIGETKGAIGYLAFSYFDGTVKPLSLDGVEPTSENVYNNSFPVWAYMHMYTKGEPQGATKAFLDFILTSDDVQGSLIEELKYIPVSKMTVERSVDGAVTNK